MAELSDEMLMAYADGELGPRERADIEEVLMQRPDLRERVARFNATGRVLQGVFAGTDHEASAADLEARVRALPTHNVVSDLAAERAARRAGEPPVIERAVRRGWQPLALAASLGLLLGAAGGWIAHPGSADGNGAIEARGGLATSLSTALSGVVLTTRDGTVKPILSFRNKDGRYCRQYEMTGAPGAVFEGLACAASSGHWSVLYHAEVAAAGSPGSGLGPAGQRQRSPLDGLVRRTIAGGSLDPLEEQKAIEAKWR